MEVNIEERWLANLQSVLRLVSSWEVPERESRNGCGRQKPNLKGWGRRRGPRRRRDGEGIQGSGERAEKWLEFKMPLFFFLY